MLFEVAETRILDRRFALIQVDLPGIVPSWGDWMQMAKLEGIDSTRGLRLNVADHALDAASEGVGVVLAYKIVASRDIAAGRLVAPFGPEIPLPGRSYFFCCAKGEEAPCGERLGPYPRVAEGRHHRARGPIDREV